MNLIQTIMDYLQKKYPTPPSLIERNETMDKFPAKVYKVWLAGEKGLYKYKMPYFKNDIYQEYHVGQVVHLLTIGKYKGFYQITDIERPYGDYAEWDDGKKYSFVLSHVKKAYKKISCRKELLTKGGKE